MSATAAFDPCTSAAAIARVLLPVGRSFIGPLELSDALRIAETERRALARTLLVAEQRLVREAVAFGLDPLNQEWACAQQALRVMDDLDGVDVPPALECAITRMRMHADELDAHRTRRMRLCMASVGRDLGEVLAAFAHADAVLDHLRVARTRLRRSVIANKKTARNAPVALPVSPKRRYNEMCI